jgi:hypothetical protein
VPLTAHQRREALARLAAGETQADVARTYAVDPTTIGRLQLPSREADLAVTYSRANLDYDRALASRDPALIEEKRAALMRADKARRAG